MNTSPCVLSITIGNPPDALPKCDQPIFPSPPFGRRRNRRAVFPGCRYGEPSSPTPAPTPDKPLTGDVKGAGEEKPPDQQPPEVAEAEPEKEGEMSPKQAALLLQAMKDEEQKVQLDEHKPVRPVYNDW